MNKILLSVIILVSVGSYFYFTKENTDFGVGLIDDEGPQNSGVSPRSKVQRDCPLSSEDLKEALNPKGSEVTDVIHHELKFNERGHHQEVFLKDGRTVEFFIGGCEHLSYRFIINPYQKSLRKKDWIKAATEFLQSPLLTIDGQEYARVLLDGLSKPDILDQENGETLFLDCPEASCQINVSEGKLMITYDRKIL